MDADILATGSAIMERYGALENWPVDVLVAWSRLQQTGKRQRLIEQAPLLIANGVPVFYSGRKIEDVEKLPRLTIAGKALVSAKEICADVLRIYGVSISIKDSMSYNKALASCVLVQRMVEGVCTAVGSDKFLAPLTVRINAMYNTKNAQYQPKKKTVEIGNHDGAGDFYSAVGSFAATVLHGLKNIDVEAVFPMYCEKRLMMLTGKTGEFYVLPETHPSDFKDLDETILRITDRLRIELVKGLPSVSLALFVANLEKSMADTVGSYGAIDHAGKVRYLTRKEAGDPQKIINAIINYAKKGEAARYIPPANRSALSTVTRGLSKNKRDVWKKILTPATFDERYEERLQSRKYRTDDQERAVLDASGPSLPSLDALREKVASPIEKLKEKIVIDPLFAESVNKLKDLRRKIKKEAPGKMTDLQMQAYSPEYAAASRMIERRKFRRLKEREVGGSGVFDGLPVSPVDPASYPASYLVSIGWHKKDAAGRNVFNPSEEARLLNESGIWRVANAFKKKYGLDSNSIMYTEFKEGLEKGVLDFASTYDSGDFRTDMFNSVHKNKAYTLLKQMSEKHAVTTFDELFPISENMYSKVARAEDRAIYFDAAEVVANNLPSIERSPLYRALILSLLGFVGDSEDPKTRAFTVDGNKLVIPDSKSWYQIRADAVSMLRHDNSEGEKINDYISYLERAKDTDVYKTTVIALQRLQDSASDLPADFVEALRAVSAYHRKAEAGFNAEWEPEKPNIVALGGRVTEDAIFAKERQLTNARKKQDSAAIKRVSEELKDLRARRKAYTEGTGGSLAVSRLDLSFGYEHPELMSKVGIGKMVDGALIMPKELQVSSLAGVTLPTATEALWLRFRVVKAYYEKLRSGKGAKDKINVVDLDNRDYRIPDSLANTVKQYLASKKKLKKATTDLALFADSLNITLDSIFSASLLG